MFSVKGNLMMPGLARRGAAATTRDSVELFNVFTLLSELLDELPRD
jgi:hypothetical protein